MPNPAQVCGDDDQFINSQNEINAEIDRCRTMRLLKKCSFKELEDRWAGQYEPKQKPDAFADFLKQNGWTLSEFRVEMDKEAMLTTLELNRMINGK